jgi:hypothetical protein
MTRPSALSCMFVAVAAVLGAARASAADDAHLRIAITPVLVENYLEVNRQLIAYVGEKLGQPTDLIQ